MASLRDELKSAADSKILKIEKTAIKIHEDTKACLEALKHVRKGILLINNRRDSIPCNKILPKCPIETEDEINTFENEMQDDIALTERFLSWF
jgi:hypothetical protein